MNVADAIKIVNKTFKYSLADHEIWLIPMKTGLGDCEDYVVAVAWVLGGETRWGLIKTIFSKKIQFFYGKYPDAAHMIGYDPETDKYFDNNWKTLVAKSSWPGMEIYKKPYSPLTVLWKLKYALVRGPT